MIPLKTEIEIEMMREGGKKLARVKNSLEEAVGAGVKASEIEGLAVSLIKKEGAEPSFKMVPGYSWATCINVNEGLVHGIPEPDMVFKKGDLVSVDVGMFYKGFHTDTSFSLAIDPTPEVARFLKVGKEALKLAIDRMLPGRHIWDISGTIEETVKAAGYTPIRALVGHGVGKELHEEPQIPCFLPRSNRGESGNVEDSPKIEAGMVFAIEVMYAAGDPNVVQMPDGWTISMRDGKISGLFEETVAALASGPQIITQ